MEREPAYYSVGEDPFTTGFPLDDLETFFAQTTPVVKLPAPSPTQTIMESQATNPVGGDDPFTTGFPLDIEAFFAQAPVASKMEDFLVLVDESGAGHTAPDSHSSGDTSCCASNTAADMGRSSPLPLALEVNTAADMGRSSPLPLALEVNTAAGLRQSGAGGGFEEAAVLGSCKRKKLVCSSSSQRSTQEFNLELLHVLVQSDPSATDINPPAGSTDKEIVDFLRREVYCMPPGKAVNLSLGEQDQICPKAVRSYVTTVEMMPDQKTHLCLGCWKEKQGEFLRAQNYEFGTMYYGVLKRTFQFHNYDGTKTNWFMHEYIPSGQWGIDLFI